MSAPLPDYELIRSDRRSLSLEIRADGSLVVRAPKRMAEARIRAFVEAKRGWIEEKRALARARETLYPPLRVEDGAALPYLGGRLTLRFAAVKAPEKRGDELLLPPEAGEAALREWLRGETRRLLLPRLTDYAARMGLEYRSLRVTSARGRWGSCSGKDGLNFTFRLAMCRPEAIDYVAVHELCHVRHKDHSRAFWAMVERYCPDWRAQRQWLREHRALMELL